MGESISALVVLCGLVGAHKPPIASVLIERFNSEKSPVWADGDTVTFFFRGEALKVELIAGGDIKSLMRIPSSDVWTVALKLPELERAVISYHLTATTKGSTRNQVSHQEGVWRGAKAPPGAVEAADLRGSIRTLEIESQAIAARRKLTVYLPPDRLQDAACRVVYATDGEEIERYAKVLEPLVTAGKLPPLALIGVHSGGYLGGAPSSAEYDAKKDLRAQEYFPGINPQRFAKHERFFCFEVAAWAEREWKVSREAKDRILFGCSNGGRFVYEMAIRHPDRFGSVLAFSVAGGGPITLPAEFKTQTRFYLEAGTWEQHFQVYTSRLAEKLGQFGVHAELRSRVGGHDEAIWREEFANGLLRAFGSR
jgi:enterochelin esterase-like enzyme